MKNFFILLSVAVVCACAGPSALPESMAQPETAVVYSARRVVTMSEDRSVADAVAVRDGRVVGVGRIAALERQFPGARRDDSFAQRVIVPGLIDPHIHVVLGGLLYAQPFAPPWPMAMPEGMTEGYPTRASFLNRLAEIVRTAPGDDSPVIVYGYHNLIQGEIDRSVLDSISPDRPLIVWHYSGHDLYLNTAALDLVGATSALSQRFHGVELTANGELTGRLYEDAGFLVFQRLGATLFNPQAVARGTNRYFEIMRRAGVTTSADLAYGVFGLEAEDRTIAQMWSMERQGFRLYLVPEFRSFERQFGGAEQAASAIADMVAGRTPTAAPVLPRVKFFSDGAFYSQTMRLSAPGYLAGQSRGNEGEWVVEPERLAMTIRPYMRAGLGVHIHSNGDAAQSSTLDALATLRSEGLDGDFVIEHAGLFSPDQIRRAARSHAMISAASHYAYYLGNAYSEPLGAPRRDWISPVGAFRRAGLTLALHSDAPLAPPQPLRAAGVQITRATREGIPYQPAQALSRRDALRSVTIDAARVLGLEEEIGSIEVGKRADFTILDADPLQTPGERWAAIGVWGVVLGGELRPIAH